ncbi:MAG TPA: short-chain dehydrogenase/reductase [Stellaceae bacterium]|jgi:NAD(P)-dependent dehydrogenase (short-subunit alcohol dehydrogenase family)
MDLHLAGKKALITGASRGIGFAVAKCLLGEGAVVRIAARPGERIEHAGAALREAGAKDFAAYALDLSVPQQRAELEESCGDVDILVNCAGVIPRQTIEEMSEEAWRQSWELKLFGSIDLTRRYYARMKAQRRGVIINVIGSAGLRPDYNFAAGSVANSALMSLTSALGGVSPDFNVRILGVNPGSVRTERTLERLKIVAKQRFGDESRWPEIENELIKRQPFGQTQKPEQIAAVIAFLASDHAQYVTGTTITVDGGASARTMAH